MPLSFFTDKLGASNSLRAVAGDDPVPLFFAAVLGMPKNGFGTSAIKHSNQLSFGSRRWTPIVPNSSSFPLVASGAKRPLDIHRICTAAVPRSIRRGHAS